MTLAEIRAKGEARKAAVRAFADAHPDMSMSQIGIALGMPVSTVSKDTSPRKTRKGSADSRMATAYEELTSTYTVTPTILCKRAKTAFSTARRWLKQNHPADLINRMGVKCRVEEFQRIHNGRRETIKGHRRSFPRKCTMT
jgi:hypothetical protein